MSGSYFQSFVHQKQQKEKELKEVSAETKSLSRVVYKLKTEMQNLKNEMKDSNPDHEILDVLNKRVDENSREITKMREEALISQEDLKQEVSNSVNDYLEESLHSTNSSDDSVKTKLKEVIDSIRTSLHLDHQTKLTNMDSKLQALDNRFQQLEVEVSTRPPTRRTSQKSHQSTKSKDRRKQRHRAFYKAIVKPKTPSNKEVDFYFARMQALFKSLQLALHDLKHHNSNNDSNSINYKF